MRSPIGALVGTPNAGKSTLLNRLLGEVSSAHVRTADYPFSTHTIERCALTLPLPSESCERGQWHCELWDTPSLTDGSSQGRGLGNQFLQALQAVDFLILVVTSEADIEVLERELGAVKNIPRLPRLLFTRDEILKLADTNTAVDLLWQKMRQTFKDLSLFTLQINQQRIHLVRLHALTVGELLETIHPDLRQNRPAVTDQRSGQMAPLALAIKNGDTFAISPHH